MANMTRAHVIISGRVQGVFFRMETQNAARRIGGITGWVKNRRDGDVEAVFEGEQEKVDEMLKWCEKGSPQSRVDHVDVKRESYAGEFSDFRITH